MRDICVFDPARGFAPLTDPIEVTDPSVFRRGNQWWMCVATEVAHRPGIQLATATLPDGAPLSRDSAARDRPVVVPVRSSLAAPRRLVVADPDRHRRAARLA